jgi:hypothetical protein
VADSCEHGIEPSGPIKCEAFLDQLGDCQVVKFNYAAQSSLMAKRYQRAAFV